MRAVPVLCPSRGALLGYSAAAGRMASAYKHTQLQCRVGAGGAKLVCLIGYDGKKAFAGWMGQDKCV